ncbi:hypothetical protein AVEN_119519-1 [Araneus ventricosus]|uniref:Uncharacterized protein n=1 Tax=Araneus ventricosus TaxID=182803 RepID=A0A4Y2WRH4_ARAVE|nr:hypothetical protein AVEN_119519-1 [Araneus ventricosus]
MNAVSIPDSEELEVLSPSCIEIVQINSVSCGPEVRTMSGLPRCGKVNPRLTQLPPSSITRKLMSLSANEN